MLQIDPRLPLAWISPSTVRVGIQAAVAVIHDVDDDVARLLDRMRRGVVDSEPAVTLGKERAARVLAELAPALASNTRQRLTVRVVGEGAIAATIAAVLRDDGHSISARAPELVVAIAQWRLPEPERQRLLQRDTPHVTVTLGDQHVTVGPYTVPGYSACSRCAALAEDDPFVPVSLPAVVHVPAGTAAQIVASAASAVNAIASGQLDPGAGVIIDLQSASVTEKTWDVAAQCGCQALPETAMPLAPDDQTASRTTSGVPFAPE